MYIKNRGELESHGNRELRRAALDIAEYALERVNPYRATRELVHLQDHRLLVGDLEYDLNRRGDIYVLGAGKATLPIARALEEVLGEHIRYSMVAIKEGQDEATNIVRFAEASHPLPDTRGCEAAREALRLAHQAGQQDIVFTAITGGSSALWPCPVEGLSLEDKREVHKLLLECGASIREINAVRKHLSRIKGGRLALAAFPAEVINLTVSDVTGDPYDYITCPTVPDTSTFADALKVLERYSLWDKMPSPAVQYLKTATSERENPRDFGQERVHTFLLVKSGEVCEAAAYKAAQLGFEAEILTCEMEGDSGEAGKEFGHVVGAHRGSHLALIAGGETTVHLDKGHGEGGPNQEFACGAALALNSDDQVVLSLDTDGTDGPTELAGALVDSSTASRATGAGMDVAVALARHDVSPLLRRLGDAVVTGHTGTNVNDLKIGLRGRPQSSR
ncbi:MAG: glycerate kinase type-2 family protein [Chloroflexota bacterium]